MKGRFLVYFLIFSLILLSDKFMKLKMKDAPKSAQFWISVLVQPT